MTFSCTLDGCNVVFITLLERSNHVQECGRQRIWASIFESTTLIKSGVVTAVEASNACKCLVEVVKSSDSRKKAADDKTE